MYFFRMQIVKAYSKNWISKMTSSFESKDIVLGISPYKKTKGILNKFIRFDEFIVMLQYLSYTRKNSLYGCR